MPGGTPQEDLRRPRRRSRIAQERLQPGPAGWSFILALGALALGVFTFLALITHRPESATSAEAATETVPGAAAALRTLFGLQGTRLLAAAAAALLVAAVGVAARRFLGSDAGAMLAAWLVAVDPAVLATGHLAVPHAFVLAASFGALALFLLPSVRAHWTASILLVLAALFDPAAILWGVPLLLLVLVRGHIYAAPVHLGHAAFQTLLLPAIAAGTVAWSRAAAGVAASCLRLDPLEGLLLLHHQDLGGPVALPDPAIWSAGLVALAAMSGTAALQVLRSFRLARIPGRIQLRLPAPLRVSQARILWVAVLALAVPHPLAWLPLAAIGLSAGVLLLAEDAPGFGITVGLVAAAFAGLWTLRTLSLVLGTADADTLAEVLSIVPWSSPTTCGV